MTKPTDRPQRSQTANGSEPTKASQIPESIEGSTRVLWYTQGSSENRESVFKKPLGLLMKSKKRR